MMKNKGYYIRIKWGYSNMWSKKVGKMFEIRIFDSQYSKEYSSEIIFYPVSTILQQFDNCLSFKDAKEKAEKFVSRFVGETK